MIVRCVRATSQLEQKRVALTAVLDASRTGFRLVERGEVRVANAAYEDLCRSVPAPPVGEPVTVATDDGRVVRVTSRSLEDGRLLVSADDVTRQVREREHSGRFMAEIVAAKEEEARRVAGLLHDDAVQSLTALGLRLELAERKAGLPVLGELAADAHAVTRTLRRLMTDLYPTVLETQGLAAAIELASEGLREQGVEVNVTTCGTRAPHELEALAYRVAHEAIVNVAKHARASHVDVVVVVDRALRCEVRDDGIGFDDSLVDSGLSRGALGLHVARERVERAGGTLGVRSAPTVGTRIAFELPLVPGLPARGDLSRVAV
jgi:signal transduction histidine kinase